MHFLRIHWFDLGQMAAAMASTFLPVTHPTGLALLLWLSRVALFLQQFEEYGFPGYFPGMMNSFMFSSRQPDRYPLNAQTALIITVIVGPLLYFLAAVLSEKVVWLGIATILVSAGNVIAHTFLFNIRGKTVYNPGILTAIVLFLPLSIAFFSRVIHNHTASTLDCIAGVVLGMSLNYTGILKMIEWKNNANTFYVFLARCLVPGQQHTLAERS